MKTPILESVKFTMVEAAAAAGQGDLTSDEVDMKGYESCVFLTQMGTITGGAVTSLKVQGSNTSGSNFTDLEGTDLTIAASDSDQAFAVEVVKAPYRYLRCVLLRGTQNAVTGDIWAIQAPAKSEPVTNTVTDTFTQEINYSPAAGTA